MHDLIYFCVRGAVYREMLIECISTLRGVGAYTGKITVFTPDLCATLRSLRDVTICVKQWSTPAMLDRVYALLEIPALTYRTVTGLDADILAFHPIADLLGDQDHVRYMEEPWLRIGNCTHWSMYCGTMTEEEKIRFSGHHTINVGHFTVPGALMTTLAQAWVLGSATASGFGADQAAFNALIRRGAVPARPYGPRDVVNATMTPREHWREYALAHFAGDGTPEQRLEKMRNVRREWCEPPPGAENYRGFGRKQDAATVAALRPRLPKYPPIP